jgi:hypothetical protein
MNEPGGQAVRRVASFPEHRAGRCLRSEAHRNPLPVCRSDALTHGRLPVGTYSPASCRGGRFRTKDRAVIDARERPLDVRGVGSG